MLHFSELIIENFGPYKGIQEIDFTSKNGVNIIWGNNGLGKTTLLNVFRYALFGRVQGRGNKSHSLKQIANWESYDEGKYGFKVTLKMSNDGIRYDLTRQFTVKEGISYPEKDNDYKEDIFLKKEGTILSQDERKHILNSIMPEQVSRFFLFDGELLQEYEDLLSEESSIGLKIKDAIERILGVPVLTNGLADITTAEKEFSSRLSKVAQKNNDTQLLGNLLGDKQSELKKHEEELETLKTTLKELNDEKANLEEEMKQTDKARELLSEKRVQEDIKSRKREALSSKKAEIKILTKNAWQGMLNDRIKLALENLEEEINVYEEKKTKHAVSEQIIEQIHKACEQGECPICEQEISESLGQTLKSKIKADIGFEGLSDEERNKLIQLQGRRSQLRELNVDELKQQVKLIEDSISDITVEISDAEQRLSDINKSLSKLGDTTRAETVSGDYAKCLEKINNTKNGIDSAAEIIAKVTGEIKNLEDKLKQQATDDELIRAEEIRDLSGKVKEIFENGVDLYRDRLKQKVEKDASDIFTKISNQTEYTGLTINDHYGLSIIHETGRIVEIRSAGYEHIVALSLIGALHKNAPLQGPIIMDSPFGRLDPDHKRKITSALPSLAEQVILLVYSGEIDEQLARRTLGGDLINEYVLASISAFNTQITKV